MAGDIWDAFAWFSDMAVILNIPQKICVIGQSAGGYMIVQMISRIDSNDADRMKVLSHVSGIVGINGVYNMERDVERIACNPYWKFNYINGGYLWTSPLAG